MRVGEKGEARRKREALRETGRPDGGGDVTRRRWAGLREDDGLFCRWAFSGKRWALQQHPVHANTKGLINYLRATTKRDSVATGQAY